MKFSIVKTCSLCFFLLQFYNTMSAPMPGYSGSFSSQNNMEPSPNETIIRFLKWYKTNLKKVNEFPILIKDNSDNFMINKSASNKYLALLKSSKCLSLRYIACRKSFLDDKAIGLQANAVQSDIPDDFDLDFVLNTQEPELVLDHIAQLKFPRLLSVRTILCWA